MKTRSETGAMARRKGSQAERELAAALYDELGVSVTRNLNQTRAGGFDLLVKGGQGNTPLDTLAIEVKRYSTAPPAKVAQWWDQALKQAEADNLTPVLAYRANRESWRFVIPIKWVLNAGVNTLETIEWTATVSLKTFCFIVRELYQ
jgi:Holliday junction resolvase